eukprot:3357989-Pyramimonas_sp.AAC.1
MSRDSVPRFSPSLAPTQQQTKQPPPSKEHAERAASRTFRNARAELYDLQGANALHILALTSCPPP